ncbi:MAG: S-layer homology domain-containing protein [Oscillospiraceae bacterium]|nr:S-layer homology domain-containing protein [Oscillospiraceae bacterium]
MIRIKQKAGRLVGALLVLVFLAGLLPTGVLAQEPLSFPDVPKDAWYYSDVQKAVETGLISGYEDNTFGPSRNMTYAEAVKLAAVMYKLSMTGSTEFEETIPWYQSYVDYAAYAAIISRDYDWNKPATRAGYMEIFARAIPDHPANSDIKALTPINTVPDGAIPDVPMSHPQAAEIYKLYRAGILQGSDDQYSCMPDSNIRRSEVAAILTRMMDADERISFSIGGETAEEPLKIVSQPKDVSAAEGTEAVFSVTAGGGKAPYTYQWSEITRLGDEYGLIDGSENYSGTQTDTLTVRPPAVRLTESGAKYRCYVYDSNGKEVISDSAVLTVTSAASPLTITAHPMSVTVNQGDDAFFSVTVSGGKTPYQYQWHKIRPDDEDIIPEGIYYTGVNTADLTARNSIMETDNGARYYCVITDAAGDTVTSDKASVTVTDSKTPMEIAAQPSDACAAEGWHVSFSVRAAGGTEPYTYQWRRISSATGSDTALEESDRFTGTTASVMTINALLLSENGDRFYCEITDADGKTVTSGIVLLTVTVNDYFHVTTQPQSVTTSVNGDAIFTVSVSGGRRPYVYEWRCTTKDGDYSVHDGTWYKGASTPFLTVMNCADTENGVQYFCVVKDKDGLRATSNKATLTVTNNTLPLTVTIPAFVSGPAGKQFSMTAVVSGGTAPYSYTWYYAKESESDWNISGDTAKTYTPAFDSSGAWQCWCKVTDSKGKTAESDICRIDVAPN